MGRIAIAALASVLMLSAGAPSSHAAGMSRYEARKECWKENAGARRSAIVMDACIRHKMGGK